MTQPAGLVIGPGFQAWIDAHQGTPLSDELYFSREMSCMMVRISVTGPETVLLFYNKLTNEVVPFVAATL